MRRLTEHSSQLDRMYSIVDSRLQGKDGWEIKRQSGTSHQVLSRPGWPDFVFAFHENEEIGPRMLARIGKKNRAYPG